MHAAANLTALRALFPAPGPALEGLAPSGPAAAADNALFTLAGLRGKTVELSAPLRQAGSLTLALGLLLEAQLEGANCAWITASSPPPTGGPGGARSVSARAGAQVHEASTFFPPDAAALGLDLAALPVVRAPDPRAAGRAASHLLRSLAVAAVVLDLRGAGPATSPTLPQALLARLIGLAQRSDAALLILTAKAPDAESLGSILGLQLAVRCTRLAPPARLIPANDDGLAPEPPRFVVQLTATKDKRRGPGWSERRAFAAPPDLE
jgi:recombination protein RecA